MEVTGSIQVTGNVGGVDDDTATVIAQILGEVTVANERIIAMAGELQAVKDATASTIVKVDSLVASHEQISTELATVRQQLDEAIAAQDPAALAQVAADLNALQQRVDARLAA